jgi:hypothetical protein
MPPWQPAQLKPPLAVVSNSARPTNGTWRPSGDGTRLAAGLERPVERQADDHGDEQQHTEHLHALEARAFELLVVVVRLAVGRHLDFGAELATRGTEVQEEVGDPADDDDGEDDPRNSSGVEGDHIVGFLRLQ